MLRCSRCESKAVVKNGHIHNGKQRYKCKGCGRQFGYGATKKIISEETKRRIDKLLFERVSLAGIARGMEVSETWLQAYVNQKYEAVEQKAHVEAKRGASHRV